MATKQLQGLRIRQRAVEALGCIKGCLEYLGSDVSFPWLYGGTGQAFIISLDPGVDVSSVDSWEYGPQYELGRNMGYSVEELIAWQPTTDQQRDAWDFVRASIDRGVPCFGFELKARYGGYWIIWGYDDGADETPAGYYYSGWEDGGPLPWQKLGAQSVPMLTVCSVQPCEPSADGKVVSDGLAFALRHAQNPPDWIGEQAQSGPAAWTYWGEALESGQAKRDHHTYNAQLWLECRQMAVEFLSEAKARLPGRCDDLFDRAADQYDAVCKKLGTLIELHPPRETPNWGPDTTFSSDDGAALVRAIGALDAEALGLLERILQAL